MGCAAARASPEGSAARPAPTCPRQEIRELPRRQRNDPARSAARRRPGLRRRARRGLRALEGERPLHGGFRVRAAPHPVVAPGRCPGQLRPAACWDRPLPEAALPVSSAQLQWLDDIPHMDEDFAAGVYQGTMEGIELIPPVVLKRNPNFYADLRRVASLGDHNDVMPSRRWWQATASSTTPSQKTPTSSLLAGFLSNATNPRRQPGVVSTMSHRGLRQPRGGAGSWAGLPTDSASAAVAGTYGRPTATAASRCPCALRCQREVCVMARSPVVRPGWVRGTAPAPRFCRWGRGE